MIANDRVIEAVSRMTGVSMGDLKRHPTPILRLPDSMDSLDWAELVMELDEEFDEETVRIALRYVEVLAGRPEARLSDGRPTSQLAGSTRSGTGNSTVRPKSLSLGAGHAKSRPTTPMGSACRGTEG